MSYRIPGEWKEEPIVKEPNEWTRLARHILKSPWRTLASMAIVGSLGSGVLAIRSCLEWNSSNDTKIHRAEVVRAREGMHRESQYDVDGQAWAICYARTSEYTLTRKAVKVTP
jgi:hypothetical protein